MTLWRLCPPNVDIGVKLLSTLRSKVTPFSVPSTVSVGNATKDTLFSVTKNVGWMKVFFFYLFSSSPLLSLFLSLLTSLLPLSSSFFLLLPKGQNILLNSSPKIMCFALCDATGKTKKATKARKRLASKATKATNLKKEFLYSERDLWIAESDGSVNVYSYT